MKLAAFDKGQTPTVSIVNQATTPLGFALPAFAAAIQKYANLVASVWGCPMTFAVSKDGTIPAANWGLVFLDDADQAGALAYHDLTASGLPLSKVFVRTTQRAGEDVCAAASHEVAEMAADPGCQLWARNAATGSLWALELADPTQGDSFKIDGLAMSNFVFPSFFEGFRKPRSTQFDYMGLCVQPFRLRPGGYAITMRPGRIGQTFGMKRSMQFGSDKAKAAYKRRKRLRAERRGVDQPCKRSGKGTAK